MLIFIGGVEVLSGSILWMTVFAVQIFTAYTSANGIEEVRAEHDEIYIGDTAWPITDADKERLKYLGFTPCDEDCYHAFT